MFEGLKHSMRLLTRVLTKPWEPKVVVINPDIEALDYFCDTNKVIRRNREAAHKIAVRSAAETDLIIQKIMS